MLTVLGMDSATLIAADEDGRHFSSLVFVIRYSLRRTLQ